MKRQEITNAGKDMKKGKLLYILGGNVKLGQLPWSFLKKLKLEVPYDPSNSTSAYISKENKITIWKRCLYLHVYCGIMEKSLCVHRWMNGYREWTEKILFSLIKRRKSSIHDNKDELGGLYAKWNKPTEKDTY